MVSLYPNGANELGQNPTKERPIGANFGKAYLLVGLIINSSIKVSVSLGRIELP